MNGMRFYLVAKAAAQLHDVYRELKGQEQDFGPDDVIVIVVSLVFISFVQMNIKISLPSSTLWFFLGVMSAVRIDRKISNAFHGISSFETFHYIFYRLSIFNLVCVLSNLLQRIKVWKTGAI